MTDDDIKAIRERLEAFAATGSTLYAAMKTRGNEPIYRVEEQIGSVYGALTDYTNQATVEMIAHAPADIRALLSLVATLQAENETLRSHVAEVDAVMQATLRRQEWLDAPDGGGMTG